jgi:hypothetical protein
LKFDSGFVFSTESTRATIHQPSTHEEGSTAYYKKNDKYIKVNILLTPVDNDNDHYVIQETESGNILEVFANEILDHNPNDDPTEHQTSTPFPHIPWLKNGARVTLYLANTMPHPKQGKLYFRDNKWIFAPGRLATNTPIELPNFESLAESMIANHKLFEGWKSRTYI